MDLIQSIILGLLQGLTEFLPISSSGHILILPAILGWEDPGAAFTAVIQLGTELAVLLYFRKDLWGIARDWTGALFRPEMRGELNVRMGWYLVAATIPIAILGYTFENQIETAARNLWLVASMLIVFGIVLGLMVAFIIFGRRAQKNVYRKAEGQTGAAAWALENMRGKWRVAPGVAVNGHFDAVHRVVGRPGVIFVGEGSATRVKSLIAQEKKRTARLIGEIPIYDIVVGAGEGEVPLDKLERHLTRLPANISVKQMDTLENKLTALGTKAGPAAMPKGPLPPQAKMRGVQRSMKRR